MTGEIAPRPSQLIPRDRKYRLEVTGSHAQDSCHLSARQGQLEVALHPYLTAILHSSQSFFKHTGYCMLNKRKLLVISRPGLSLY